jgi:PAS domain S-box-containing protein
VRMALYPERRTSWQPLAYLALGGLAVLVSAGLVGRWLGIEVGGLLAGGAIGGLLFVGVAAALLALRGSRSEGVAAPPQDSAHAHIERQRDLYALLSQCNHVVARVDDRQSLFQSIVRLSVEGGRFKFAWIGELRDGGDVARVASFGRDEGNVGQVVVSAREDDPRGRGPVGRAFRDGKTEVANRFQQNPSTAPWHDLAARTGIKASASVPIRTLGKVTHVLTLYSEEEDFFEGDLVATLEQMAEEISFGLDGLHLRSQLQESRNLLQSVIDASATPVYAFDCDGRALLMNQACARLFGRPLEDLIGRTRAAMHSGNDAKTHQDFDRRVFESGEPLSVEERMGEGDDARVFLSVKFPLRRVDGTVMAVGGVSTEITELRRAQVQAAAANSKLEETVAERTKELVAARDRAEQADRAKTAFLSTVSHELRTPLNSIIGFTDIVVQGLAGPLTPEQHHQLSIVQESARILLDLINEILDLSRIEAGRLHLSPQQFDLADLLRRRVDALASHADHKGIQLEARIAAGVSHIQSDPKRVAQIVSNLLANAIKFTEHGSVVLAAHADAEHVTVVVEDTGPGISAEDLALIFRPFVQVGGNASQHRDGTGLGLVISQYLARAMGGEIKVQSTLGKGSRFELVLPLELTTDGEAARSGLYPKLTSTD